MKILKTLVILMIVILYSGCARPRPEFKVGKSVQIKSERQIKDLNSVYIFKQDIIWSIRANPSIVAPTSWANVGDWVYCDTNNNIVVTNEIPLDYPSTF